MDADFVIDFVTALWLGFIGACIGSFLNVVAYRVPRGMSVIWKASHCPKCKHPIRARDNVPILGWLLLRGKCRDCGVSISPRYAIVEGVMGLVFFGLAYADLLRGGRYTNLSGATNVVWNPEWRALAVYAFHCLLSCIFMIVLLMRLDKALSLQKFVLATVILVLLWALADSAFRID